MNRGPRRIIGCLAAACTLSPELARAHLVTTGLGPVYDGIGHFALSAADVMPVVALALYAGLRGPAAARRVLFLLPTVWMLGGLAAWRGLYLPDRDNQWSTAVLFLLVGGMLVGEGFSIGGRLHTGGRAPRLALLGIVVLMGIVRGDADMTGFLASGAATRSVVLVPFLGGAIAVFVTTALAASLSLPLKAPWSRLLVCITGSWSAALGLLLLGWSIHRSMLALH